MMETEMQQQPPPPPQSAKRRLSMTTTEQEAGDAVPTSSTTMMSLEKSRDLTDQHHQHHHHHHDSDGGGSSTTTTTVTDHEESAEPFSSSQQQQQQQPSSSRTAAGAVAVAVTPITPPRPSSSSTAATTTTATTVSSTLESTDGPLQKKQKQSHPNTNDASASCGTNNNTPAASAAAAAAPAGAAVCVTPPISSRKLEEKQAAAATTSTTTTTTTTTITTTKAILKKKKKKKKDAKQDATNVAILASSSIVATTAATSAAEKVTAEKVAAAAAAAAGTVEEPNTNGKMTNDKEWNMALTKRNQAKHNQAQGKAAATADVVVQVVQRGGVVRKKQQYNQGEKRKLSKSKQLALLARAAEPPPIKIPKSDLRPNDVILGRGSRIAKWPGNARFRLVIRQHRDEYLQAPKMQRNEIATNIYYKLLKGDVAGVDNDGGCRFLEDCSEEQCCYTVNKLRAVEKVAQACREKCLYNNSSSLPPPPPPPPSPPRRKTTPAKKKPAKASGTLPPPTKAAKASGKLPPPTLPPPGCLYIPSWTPGERGQHASINTTSSTLPLSLSPAPAAGPSSKMKKTTNSASAAAAAAGGAGKKGILQHLHRQHAARGKMKAVKKVSTTKIIPKDNAVVKANKKISTTAMIAKNDAIVGVGKKQQKQPRAATAATAATTTKGLVIGGGNGKWAAAAAAAARLPDTTSVRTIPTHNLMIQDHEPPQTAAAASTLVPHCHAVTANNNKNIIPGQLPDEAVKHEDLFPDMDEIDCGEEAEHEQSDDDDDDSSTSSSSDEHDNLQQQQQPRVADHYAIQNSFLLSHCGDHAATSAQHQQSPPLQEQQQQQISPSSCTTPSPNAASTTTEKLAFEERSCCSPHSDVSKEDEIGQNGSSSSIKSTSMIRRQKSDGTFARPFGPTPLGCRWDEIRGFYVPMDSVLFGAQNSTAKKKKNKKKKKTTTTPRSQPPPPAPQQPILPRPPPLPLEAAQNNDVVGGAQQHADPAPLNVQNIIPQSPHPPQWSQSHPLPQSAIERIDPFSQNTMLQALRRSLTHPLEHNVVIKPLTAPLPQSIITQALQQIHLLPKDIGIKMDPLSPEVVRQALQQVNLFPQTVRSIHQQHTDHPLAQNINGIQQSHRHHQQQHQILLQNAAEALQAARLFQNGMQQSNRLSQHASQQLDKVLVETADPLPVKVMMEPAQSLSQTNKDVAELPPPQNVTTEQPDLNFRDDKVENMHVDLIETGVPLIPDDVVESANIHPLDIIVDCDENDISMFPENCRLLEIIEDFQSEYLGVDKHDAAVAIVQKITDQGGRFLEKWVPPVSCSSNGSNSSSSDTANEAYYKHLSPSLAVERVFCDILEIISHCDDSSESSDGLLV